MLDNWDYEQVAKRSVGPHLSDSVDYQIFLDIVADELRKSDGMIENIDNVYNISEVDSELLPNIADTLEINYPIEKTDGQLRLLLRYFRKILKYRGSIKAMEWLLKIIDHDAESYANANIDQLNSIEITQPSDGTIVIRYPYLDDDVFAKKMLKYVVDAGSKVIINP